MIDGPRPRPNEGRPSNAPLPDARRRRRVRVPDAAPAGFDETSTRDEPAPGSPAVVGNGDTAASAQTAPVHEEPSTLPAIDVDVVAVERGLRSIVGSGSSQVTPGAALRARDAARPRPADLERAEAELTITRRHWTPRD